MATGGTSRQRVELELGQETKRRFERLTSAVEELARASNRVKTAVDAFEPKEDSNLVQHFRRELKIAGVEEGVSESLIAIADIWSRMDHSGGSHSAILPLLVELLNHHNIMPLTDDPEEWFFHGKEMSPPEGLWQNKRNGEAFSHDGGKTYYLVSEDGTENAYRKGETKMHTSKSHVQLRAVQEAKDS